MPASPQAYLRAINAPPIFGPYSAMTTDSYTGAGIGVGPGGMMVRKSPQEIEAAAAAWDAVLGAGGGGNRFSGLIFGDTPGAAQSNVLSLRAAREAEALNRAQLAFQQANAAAQLRAQQQNADLSRQLQKYGIDQTSARSDAQLAQQDLNNTRTFLASLMGTAAKGGGASDPAAIQAILDGSSAARSQAVAAGSSARSVAQAMYESARDAAMPFGKVVSVTPSTSPHNPLPLISVDAKALETLDKATRDTNFSGGLDNPAALMQHLTDAALTGTGARSVPAGPFNITIPVAENRMDQFHQALNQQEAAKAQLDNIAQTLAMRRELGLGAGGSSSSGGGGGRAGLSMDQIQQLMQLTARAPGAGVGLPPQPPPAPTYVGGRSFGAVPPPLTILDQLNAAYRATPTGPRQLLPATRNDAAAQAAWYAANPNVAYANRAPGYAPALGPAYGPENAVPFGQSPAAAVPMDSWASSGVDIAAPLPADGKFVMDGGRVVPAGGKQPSTYPDLAIANVGSRSAIFDLYRQAHVAAGADPAMRDMAPYNRTAAVFEPLDLAIAEKLNVKPERIGSSIFVRSPVEVVARARDEFIAKMDKKFGPRETNLILLEGLNPDRKPKKK